MHPLVIGNADNEVMPTHPLHNIPPKSVYKVLMHFQENNYDLYCEKFKNGIWDDNNEYDKRPSSSSTREGSVASSQMSSTDEQQGGNNGHICNNGTNSENTTNAS